MTTREASFDHAAEAEKYLDSGFTHRAQVHATLALVEQQRIANLIALGQSRAGDESLAFRHLIMQPINEYAVGPTDDIKKGLGL